MGELLLHARIRLAVAWRNHTAQDWAEYALGAGFVAISAGTLWPGMASAIVVILVKFLVLLAVVAGANMLGQRQKMDAPWIRGLPKSVPGRKSVRVQNAMKALFGFLG
jgi:hypothetical protein